MTSDWKLLLTVKMMKRASRKGETMASQLKIALLGGLLSVLVCSAAPAIAASTAAGPESNGGVATQAATFSGCVAPGRTITHRVNLPARGSFLHRVFPDRRGFNVVMTIDYPGLFRRVNQFGPGRTESFTVRTPNGRVSGRVRISGVGGSFGCYTLRVTP